MALAKLLLEGKRQRDQERLEKIRERFREEVREIVRVVQEETQERNRDTTTRVHRLEELLRKNGIEVPPGLG